MKRRVWFGSVCGLEVSVWFGSVCVVHISNSHLEREDWGVVRAVSRLESVIVPLGFFEIPSPLRFLLQVGWPYVRWLAARMRCSHSWTFRVCSQQDGVDIHQTDSSNKLCAGDTPQRE